MNCLEWEREIASESESAGLAEHLGVCANCREFAREVEANHAALSETAVHPAAFTAVRARVRAEIQASRRRRAWWMWSAAAAAVCVAILSVSYLVMPKRVAPAKVAPVVAQVAPVAPTPQQTVASQPRLSNTRRASVRKRTHKFGLVADHSAPAQKTEPLVIKMLTNDPNVIIVWLVDPKGDSL